MDTSNLVNKIRNALIIRKMNPKNEKRLVSQSIRVNLIHELIIS